MMKKAVLFILTCLLLVPVVAQRTAEDYYNDGMKYAGRKNYKEAIDYFDMAVRLKADDFYSMHQRGVCKALMGNYPEAIEDFKKVLTFKPDYTAAMIAMGNCYKRLTYYDTAVNMYSRALEFEADNQEALYHRAHVYESMNMADSAAADFNDLMDLGFDASEKVKFYKDTAKNRPVLHTINKVSQKTEDATYGFTEKNPVKVGTGKQGGFGNVKAYLDQLRDAKKKPVAYKRIKACCPYKKGGASYMLEEYEITYPDETGVNVTKKLYLTYFEYEDPKVPVGLASVSK